MPVDKPVLEIKCECLSDDTKRVLRGMVRSHNAVLNVNKATIREMMPLGMDEEKRLQFEDALAKILLDQELMENLQDLLDDLPTCFEYHHGKDRSAAGRIKDITQRHIKERQEDIERDRRVYG